MESTQKLSTEETKDSSQIENKLEAIPVENVHNYIIENGAICAINFKTLTKKPIRLNEDFLYIMSKELLTKEGRLYSLMRDMGNWSNKGYSSSNYSFGEFNFTSNTFEPKCAPCFSEDHSILLETGENCIAKIGAYKSKQTVMRAAASEKVPTGKCELYSQSADNWTEMPDLNIVRTKFHGFYIPEQRALYVAGCCFELQFYSIIIERAYLNESLKSKWEVLNVIQGTSFTSVGPIQCLLVNSGEILLLGEHTSRAYSKFLEVGNVIAYNSETNQTCKPAQLAHSDSFRYLHCTAVANGRHYLISSNYNLHIFNGKKWIVIKEFIRAADTCDHFGYP